MITLQTYDERKEYLYLGDKLCQETFGNQRYLNQVFYTSKEWRRVRDLVIIRDLGCDLGVEGCDLRESKIIIHHINPITAEDIINRSPKLFDMDNLVAMSQATHNYIHYGTATLAEDRTYVGRSLNDTCPWKL